MKLFHWKAEQIEFLVMSESAEAARTVLVENINAWRWQNPTRFDAVLEIIQGPPYYEAEPGHVIAIDRSEQ